MTAFGLKPDEFVAPDWIVNYNEQTTPVGAYDIEAKLPAGATKEQSNEMMQNLLAARFHLAYHFEKRSFDGYDLVVAKGGPKLKRPAPPDGAGPSKSDADIPRAPASKDQDGFPNLPPGHTNVQGFGTPDGHMRLAWRMMPIVSLTNMLQNTLRNYHVVDKTGLTGAYDFRLDFVQDRTADDSGPDVFAAVENQLGLKFEKTKVDAQVLVVDHIDKTPTEN